MHVRILMSSIIYTLTVLATVSCLSIGMWQYQKSPVIRLQTHFDVGLGLRSPVLLPNGFRFLDRPRGSNYLDSRENLLNAFGKKIKNNSNPTDALIKTVADYYENNLATNVELNKAKNNSYKTYVADGILESKNNKIAGMTDTTTEITEITTEMSKTTTGIIETTTEYTTDVYSTENYDLTTDDDLYRIAVNPSVVASILG